MTDVAALVAAGWLRKTQPAGALGRLEEVVCRLAAVQQRERPVLETILCHVFCGDHGIARRGVSAYPREVTAQMLANLRAGGAASAVLCRELGIGFTAYDVGVDHDAADPTRVGRGTRDLLVEPAMTPGEMARALDLGRAAVRGGGARGESPDGPDVVILGEMGIGNTTVAAILAQRLLGGPADRYVGRGTGIDDATFVRKQAVVAAAASLPFEGDAPLEVLQRFGGLEIAALVGGYLGLTGSRTMAVVDGAIASVAALIAVSHDARVRPHLIFGHRSPEPAHGFVLQALGARPLLDLDLRLGEATGGLVAVPILRLAVALYRSMSEFDAAGVSGRLP
jgi:nicotinate-nucleotide--dimethylbenzimidazole phosphoribosyltransferase